jgi:NTP pyrophosphatase (non-canonical NTP hydrolase)
VDIADFQGRVAAAYGERDAARGRPATVAWLAEEVGELAQAARKGTPAQQLHELGDVLAWLASLAEQLGLTERIVVTDVVESGNTSAARIPLGLSRWWHAGRIPPDRWALLFGFGGGFAYAAQVVRTPER